MRTAEHPWRPPYKGGAVGHLTSVSQRISYLLIKKCKLINNYLINLEYQIECSLEGQLHKRGSRGASYVQKISKSKEITYVYLVYVRKTKGSYNILATPEYQPSF